ncbi:malate synthase [Acanthopleuribacter pedis]|uniref:malate synthase n=1 Tax=Acanthopleuribacter pedis TaxID=442870 RepID=A0A8J7QTY6_9BACT|nr:malate synthase [Acanthopleuribacter pedis]MBO1323303.1 malate synthase A [Acanthopleuribacter pedis]
MTTNVIDATQTDPAFQQLSEGVLIHSAALTEDAKALLTPEAVALLATLSREFEPSRQTLLATRLDRQARFDAGEVPQYLDRQSEAVRGDWRVAPLPKDLQKRRVEITGPVNSTKMVINMLSRNSDGFRADCAMLDFEDSMKPSWTNVVDGVHNFLGAAKGDLRHVDPARADRPEKVYQLDADDMALVMVRVRGLHLDESNLLIDGKPVSGGLLDLVLCWFHGAKELIKRGKTPKFYVPKVEHYLEARWWNDIFTKLEAALDLPLSTLRATFLIETLPAAFQIEEILYELRDHAAGLNVGRWDKIFSDIKTLKFHKDRVMADRASIGMNRPWMNNYAKRLIQICHQRGASALGGMAAFTPGRDAELRQKQTEKVAADKQWEFDAGHDGCWVSHPYFIGTAMSAFTVDNQLDVMPEGDKYPDLLPQSGGPRTLEGLRTNARVGIAYLEGWQRDIGCIAWDNLMEDLATLEISRAQTWQWLHHGVSLDCGTPVTTELIGKIFDEELARIYDELGAAANRDSWQQAYATAVELFTAKDFQPFLSMASDLAG